MAHPVCIGLTSSNKEIFLGTQGLGCFRRTTLGLENLCELFLSSLCESCPPEHGCGIACYCSLELGCYHNAIHPAAQTSLVAIYVSLLGMALEGSHCRGALAAPEVTALGTALPAGTNRPSTPEAARLCPLQ